VEYYDDVLSAKLKRLVSGAIKRSSLEKDHPPITYEAFIQELDEGDSFTASMFDLLVKELAERRARHNPYSKHLISSQTASSLHSLANSRVYQDRDRYVRPTGSSQFLSEYLSGAPDENAFDEDDDGMTVLDGIGPGEARINHELYEAYVDPVLEDLFPQWFRTSDTNTAASTIGDDASERTLPEPVWSPPPSIRGRIGVPPNAPTLRRQSSIHRGTFRSSASDFSDFTARRRLATREGYDLIGEGGTRLESVRSPPPSNSLGVARRPFYLRRQIRRADPATAATPSFTSDVVENGSDAGSSTSHVDSSERVRRPRPVSTASWAEGPLEQSSSSTHITTIRYPRLRRGGLRPPEMQPVQPTFLMDPPVGSRSRAEQGERTIGTEAEDDARTESLRLPVTSQPASL